MTNRSLRTCPNGHSYYKSSTCPVCPRCEELRKNDLPFSNLSAPARRALENHQIRNLKELSSYSEKEILALHGIGKSAIPKLTTALSEAGLSFRK